MTVGEGITKFKVATEQRGVDASVSNDRTSTIDVEDAMRKASDELANGDAPAAHNHWKTVRQSKEGPIGAWLLAAAHADSAGGDDRRIALLEDAIQRFPNNPAPFHDLARAEERRGDWSSAEKHWRAFIDLDRSQWWAFAALSMVLREQSRSEEADSVLRTALDQFPENMQILAEMARNAERRGDWNAALSLWDAIIMREPTQWAGYRGKIATLRGAGRFVEADALYAERIDFFPKDIDALHDAARFAERIRDWPKAEAIWRAFIALEQRWSWAHKSLAMALCEQQQFDAAEAILIQAQVRFPADAGVASELAKLSERHCNWAEAERRWRRVQTLAPADPIGTLGIASALRRLARYDEADSEILKAMQTLGDQPLLHESFGLNAIAKEDWGLALLRLHAAQRRFPGNDLFRSHIFDVGLRSADTERIDAIVNVELPEETKSTDARKLVMAFESLGGGGHGCEFGIFQRHFGAEPLGLLRWADIYQDQLSLALETEFAGVGEPEFTTVFVPPSSGRAEYWTTDTRYHMAMRCFVYVDEVPVNVMIRRVTKRMRYLREKLIEDLRSASKIFVYKNMKRNLTPTELQRLYAACRRYGECTLFYIRYADADHPNGLVCLPRPGLIIGYIDHFSHSPETDQLIAPAHDSLIRLCRRAYTIWSADTTYAIEEDLGVLHTHVKSLIDLERFAEGETLLLRIVEQFPHDGVAYHDLANLARRREKWDDVERYWRAFLNIDNRKWWAYHGLADALLKLGRTQEADDIFELARKALNKHDELCYWYAKSLLDGDRPSDALAILAKSRLEESQSSHSLNFCLTFATAALKSENWSACLDATRLLEAFPVDIAATTLSHLLQTRLAEVEDAPNLTEDYQVEVVRAIGSRQNLKANMIRIESLGGDYPGCEIGLVQRRFGAETLGLLRWTTISPEDLTSALISRFAGVGTAEQTELYVTPNGSYKTRDKVYGMDMLTFVDATAVGYDQMRMRCLKRLCFLRQKLIEDLGKGEKIFAYRTVSDRLEMAEIKNIKSAMSLYGHNILLYIRIANSKNPPGSLRIIEDGLAFGYVGSFSSKPVETLHTDDWVELITHAVERFPLSLSG